MVVSSSVNNVEKLKTTVWISIANTQLKYTNTPFYSISIDIPQNLPIARMFFTSDLIWIDFIDMD